jgi:hypothetical protein
MTSVVAAGIARQIEAVRVAVIPACGSAVLAGILRFLG